MVFIKYFLRRFFSYFILITFALACLLSLIEFFEKLIHTAAAHSTQYVAHFISLNFIPTFFDIMPIGTWLATALLIKEFYQQHEWDTFLLLNITYRTLAKLFFMASIIIIIISFICKETYVARLAFTSEQFKIEKLKQTSTQKIIDKWFVISPTLLCYCNVLDLSTKRGCDIMLLFMSSTFTIEKTITAHSFYIVSNKNMLFLQQAQSNYTATQIKATTKDLSFTLPSFFSQIQINIEPPSLISSFKNIIFTKHLIPEATYREILARFIKYLLFYIHIALYALLTFYFFVLLQHCAYLKWAALLASYPFIVVITSIIDFLVSCGHTPWIFAIPYFLIFLFVFFARQHTR